MSKPPHAANAKVEWVGLYEEPSLSQAKSAGASELAVPADIRVVDSVPLLGSGKTDYVGATRLAKELAMPTEPVQQQNVAEQEVA